MSNRAWAEGTVGTVAPPLLEIRELSLPVRAQLAAGHDDAPNGNRTLTVVGLTIDGSTGWGECSALPRVGYTHESSGLAYDVLAGDPQIVQSGGAKGLVDRYPMAMAALEMAEFDLQLKRTGVSLAAYLGVSESIVPAGAVVSLGSAEQVHQQAAELVESGFRRLKLKVVPRRPCAM